MATGSVASMLYGIPRFTHDLDLVMELAPQKVLAITNAFPPDAFYAPPEEGIQLEIHRQRRGHFYLSHSSRNRTKSRHPSNQLPHKAHQFFLS